MARFWCDQTMRLLSYQHINHCANVQKNNAEISAKQIRERAVETIESPRNVVANVLQDLDDTSRLETTKLQTMIDSVTKTRNKKFGNMNVLVQQG